jgi:hypothetical protein
VPNVVDARAGFRDQQGAFGRLAVGRAARRAIRLQHRTVTTEPAGMLDAAGEAPIARRPIAVLGCDGLDVWSDRSPREHRARIAEDLLRHLSLDIGRRHGAATGLHDAPGGAAVGFGQLLDRLHEDRRLDLETVAALGKQHAEQPRVVKCSEHLGRDFPFPFDARRLGRDQRGKLARPRDAIGGTARFRRNSFKHSPRPD